MRAPSWTQNSVYSRHFRSEHSVAASGAWRGLQAGRISRRSLLRTAGRAGVGAAALPLVGCGDGQDEEEAVAELVVEQEEAEREEPAAVRVAVAGPRQSQAEDAATQAEQQERDTDPTQTQEQEQGAQTALVSRVVRGGNMRLSTPARAHDYFDPHRAVFGSTQYWMGFYMNNIVRWRNKADAVMEADICSLPELPDEQTYLFRVDQGARFWDRYPTEGGRAVTSEDLRVNFQRHIDGRDELGEEDGTFPHRDSFAKTTSMEAPDDTTFIARTDGPDATWLAIPSGPFGWITSPEAISVFGDRWRDEPTNIDLSSGTGMMIPLSYDPDIGIEMKRNSSFWKPGLDGLPLPYLESVSLASMEDPTAIETAYRGRGISIGGFPLTSVQVEGLSSDFPDHPTGSVPFGFTVITGWFNFNPAWSGWDGLGNPYLDRRFAQAMHVAVDRYQMIDTVYLGSGKPTGQEDTPWFNAYWAIPEDELLATPGFRPDRAADVDEARALLTASGYDQDRPVRLIAPEFWEVTYPGVIETERAMYQEALGIEVQFDLEPFPVILQRMIEGSYPGSGPQWTNAPVELDPTTAYGNRFLPGGSWNYFFYDYEPMAEIARRMRVTLDLETRRDLAHEAQRIALGTHPEHGLAGISPTPGVMNGIAPSIWWPFLHRGEDSLQFAHDSHRHDDTWIDVRHPDYSV